MNTWFTSDLHFGHRNMVNWRNNRGCNFADADEMNEFIIERYNSVVKPEDTVYLLGDLVMGTIADNLPLLERLNGTKFSTIGNHDRPFDCKPHRYQEWIDKYQEVGVKFVSDFMWCDSFGSFSASHFRGTIQTRCVSWIVDQSMRDNGSYMGTYTRHGRLTADRST